MKEYRIFVQIRTIEGYDQRVIHSDRDKTFDSNEIPKILKNMIKRTEMIKYE